MGDVSAPSLRRRALALAGFFALGAVFAFVPRALTSTRPALRVLIPPDATPPEVEALIDDAVLVEVGLSLGWRGDPLIRDRLVRDLRFAGEAGDESALLDLAEQLGLHRRDPLVRARLIDRAREQLQRLDPPDDATLRALYDAQRDHFTSPTVVAFDHVFIADPATRNLPPALAGTANAALPAAASPEARAATLLDALRLGDTQPTGDPDLTLGPSPTRTLPALARAVDPAFADALAKAPLDRWVGPLRSRTGLHLVRVHRRITPPEPTFSALRPALDSAWRAAQGPQVFRDRLRAARATFDLQLTR